MNQFGLYVNTRMFGGMYSDDEKYFCLEAGTNAQPVKGNKALIEKIKAAGYIVVKSRQTDENGRNVYVFWVMKGEHVHPHADVVMRRRIRDNSTEGLRDKLVVHAEHCPGGAGTEQ